MDLLALAIELAAVITPLVGILVELRRDIPDDEDGGLLQPVATPLSRAVS